MKDHRLAVVVGALLCAKNAAAFTATNSHQRAFPMSRIKLNMQPHLDSATEDASTFASTQLRRKRDQQHRLRAVAIGTLGGEKKEESFLSDFVSTTFEKGMWQTLSAASLVTGSTIGASMLILPSIASGPGLAVSSAFLLAIYLVVLTSGLVIADVAINQHESGYDVPSSYQEFAEANMDNELVVKGISAIPLLVNSLVMIFDISKTGELVSSLLSPFFSVDPTVACFGFAAILGTLLSTLTGANLSAFSSMCVSVLLVAFGALLIPGLAAVEDPVGTIMAPGLAGDEWFQAVVSIAPIVLTALQFQNVVPSITKILEFDRNKTFFAILLGSAVAPAMYIAWCYAVLGGGIETSGVAGPIMTVFTGSTLIGSSIGAAMSVTEEVETSLANIIGNDEGETKSAHGVFSLPAVMVSLSVPLAGVVAFANGAVDVSAALAVAGSFGSPLLYGVIPAFMAINQRRKTEPEAIPLVPGGMTSISGLGIAAALYVGQGFAHQVSEILSVAS